MNARFLSALCGLAVALLGVHPAGAEPVACQRAIAREAARFSEAELSALEKCARDRLVGTLTAATDCTLAPDVQAAHAKAEQKLRSAIAKACGGSDKHCAAGDPSDDALPAIGWDTGICPGFAGAACSNAIADCDDVATCLACVGGAAAERAVALYAGSAAPAVPRSDLQRCQTAIVQETSRYFRARSQALQHCEDMVFRGRLAGPCPGGDDKTLAGLAKAEATKRVRICKACGGGDGSCGGLDDLAPGAIGFAPFCPAAAASGASCAAAVTALPELVECADCVTDAHTDCLDAIAVPGLKGYPAPCAVVPTPTATATPSPTRTPTPTVTATPPAGAPAVTCERVIAKEAARLAQTRARALASCQEAKLKGKIAPDADCLTASPAGARIAKTEQRLRTKIAQACGGANRVCNAADTGAAADLAPALIGWGATTCPGFEQASCDGAVVDCGDIGGCITCVHAAAVDQLIGLAFAPAFVSPADPTTAAGKCQLAIGRATTALLLARSSALQKCADVLLKTGSADACLAAGAIAKAEDELIASVCKSCGGTDRLCGGGDDQAPAALNFPATCPAVSGPSGLCGGALSTLTDLVQCLSCVSAFKNECLDEIAIPDLRGYADACRPGGAATPTPVAPTPTAPTPSPTPGGVCGNDAIEPGEDCDDGNTVGCDACPANCRRAPVACPTAGRFVQAIQLERRDAQPLTSALFCLEYPVGTVALPGSGLVTQRVSGFPGLTTVNDFDASARVGLVGQQSLTQISLSLSLDLCTGASSPLPETFACDTISASNAGASVDPQIVSCRAVTP